MEHSYWSSVLPTLFNFTAACAILYFAVRKVFVSVIAARSEKVGISVVEAQKEYAAASQVEKEWQSRWDGTAGEIAKLYSDSQLTLDRQKTRAEERATQEQARIRHEAKLSGQGERERMMSTLNHEIVSKSVGMAEKYLEDHLGDDDQRLLVENFTEIVTHGTAR